MINAWVAGDVTEKKMSVTVNGCFFISLTSW